MDNGRRSCFLERFGRKLDRPELRLEAACIDALQACGRPGNVCELENAIERAAEILTISPMTLCRKLKADAGRNGTGEG